MELTTILSIVLVVFTLGVAIWLQIRKKKK